MQTHILPWKTFPQGILNLFSVALVTLSACTPLDHGSTMQGTGSTLSGSAAYWMGSAVQNVFGVIELGKVIVEDAERRAGDIHDGMEKLQEGKKLIKEGVLGAPASAP